MILCELGQAWKGAAAADDSCAGMWLGARHPIYSPVFLSHTTVFGITLLSRLLTFYLCRLNISSHCR
jgi:hypothetical protein